MPPFDHQSVLLTETVEALSPRPGGRYADGTLGGGGHAAALLKASSPDGWLYGCDRDGTALEAARQRLSDYSGRFELRQANFADWTDWVPPGSCDGVVLDLGMSGPQLDDGSRGFSFRLDGPLDMRMDRRQRVTAAELVNGADVDELARWFWEYGDERASRRIARAIVHDRQLRPFTSTQQLASLVERLLPRAGKATHPATRVFQALRIAVNDELGALERGLRASWTILRAGGRMAVITFHSLEDRMVKTFGRALERDYVAGDAVDTPELRTPRPAQLRWLQRKAIHAGEAELAANPRSRSAQLRVMEKLQPLPTHG